MSVTEAGTFKGENPIEKAIAKRIYADFTADCCDDYFRGEKEKEANKKAYEETVAQFPKEEVKAMEAKHGKRWTA